MALFLSTFENKVDRKGRVSVPASFRAALSNLTFPGIVAYPSFVSPAIEACGIDRMEALSRGVDDLNPFSDEHDAFAHAVFGASHQLPWDAEGRILLPPELKDYAGITERATFIGRGATFQIWEPAAARAVRDQARERARQERGILKLNPRDDGPTGGGTGR